MTRTVPARPHVPIAGGTGSVPAWARPDLVSSAPGGVTASTPAHSVWSAGKTASFVASHDLAWASQRQAALHRDGGLPLFTYGKAANPRKPNAETGLQLHAASGNVGVEAQSSSFSLVADQAVEVSSVTDAVTLGAPQHILLTAGGAALRLDSAGITLTTSGPANFKAAMKELAGPASASTGVKLAPPGPLAECPSALADAAAGGASAL